MGEIKSWGVRGGCFKLNAHQKEFNDLMPEAVLVLYPLVVDLDETLIFTDMLDESALRAFRDNPINILRVTLWLFRGKAVLKQKLASCTDFKPETLPYNDELLEWLRQQKNLGRKLVLCTASHCLIAYAIAKHLDIFDEVIASDGATNLAGKEKAALLEQRFGRDGFDYVGNSMADLAVWKMAHRAVVVNASPGLLKKTEDICEIEKIFPRRSMGISTWLRMMRVHQWLKNMLLFVPLLASHNFTNGGVWLSLVLAFLSFSLCASAVYVMNDLMDIDNDRQHPYKMTRTFASGILSARIGGGVIAPALIASSMLIGNLASERFFHWLMLYFILSCAYSFGIKRFLMIDCITLALLYTLRVIAGAVFVSNLSFWLLGFSVFIFLSLVFVKRYAEICIQLRRGVKRIHGRGYHTDDASMIQTMGIAAGYSAALVLALYLNSDAVIELYRTPELVWCDVPVLLFWISWMWLRANRGEMHDDPLIFAVKDRVSLLAGIIFVSVLLAGTVGVTIPW